MAKVRGTTTRAGKTSTSPVPGVVADRIEKPHDGRPVVVKGAQTFLEEQDLKNNKGLRPSGGVRQIGPSAIGKAGPGRETQRVGGGNWEDAFASEGGWIRSPGSRQSGSVKQIGPSDIGYAYLTSRNASPALVQLAKSYALKRGQTRIKSTPLLKSGAGRAHEWSKFAGQPGTKTVSRNGAGGTGNSVLVSGRKRAFRPEALEELESVTPEKSIVPGP